MTKKKEDPYVKYAVPRDLTIESFKEEPPLHIFGTQRIKGAVIDAPAYIIKPKLIPSQDPFLAYLEWKVSKPWYERLFLP